jgi:hypothetical protein
MRIIIGMLIGIAIVFNWSGIKNFFDGGLAGKANETPAAAAPAPAAAAAAPAAAPPDAHGDLSRATEQRLKDLAAGK